MGFALLLMQCDEVARDLHEAVNAFGDGCMNIAMFRVTAFDMSQSRSKRGKCP
jgi:hypothetical protein